MDNTNKEQYERNIKEIMNRSLQDEEVSKENLINLSTNIKQLNSYINNEIELSSNAIYNKLKWMYSNLSFNFIYELEENILLRRARKFEEKNSLTYCFQNTKELSYIQEKDSEYATLQRLSKVKEPMYYGVISESNFIKFDTALSEINARELDYVNILDSKLTQPLSTLYIGAFDLSLKGKEFPKWIHPLLADIYQKFSDKCKNNPYLLESHILCSAFFANILSRKNEGNLYEVTSVLASFILESEKIDSIIYESVQVKGAPCIVIKPKVVDEKIEHTDTISVQIKSNLGYGIYYVDKLYESENIEKNADIVWKAK
jgi:hypothetical protein